MKVPFFVNLLMCRRKNLISRFVNVLTSGNFLGSNYLEVPLDQGERVESEMGKAQLVAIEDWTISEHDVECALATRPLSPSLFDQYPHPLSSFGPEHSLPSAQAPAWRPCSIGPGRNALLAAVVLDLDVSVKKAQASVTALMKEFSEESEVLHDSL